MLSCLLLTLHSWCPAVCVEPQSQTALGAQPLCMGHPVGLAAREDTHWQELRGHSLGRRSVKLCCIWLFMFLAKRKQKTVLFVH